jgi:transposase-like protein
VATKPAGVNRNTANYYYGKIRALIFWGSLPEGGKETGECEADKSYLGVKRVRGKRGRGAAGKTPVFGLLKRGGRVFVKIVKNCSKKELMPVIQGKIPKKSVVYTDGWKGYDGLVVNGYDHYRVFHSRNEFVRGKSRVNGIENSGALPGGGWRSSTAALRTSLCCTLRSASSGTTTGTRICCRLSGNCSKIRKSARQEPNLIRQIMRATER